MSFFIYIWDDIDNQLVVRYKVALNFTIHIGDNSF